MCMWVCVCGGGGGVLLLFFSGKILGCVRRRTTTEPFTKDVVIDHERRLGELKTHTTDRTTDALTFLPLQQGMPR